MADPDTQSLAEIALRVIYSSGVEKYKIVISKYFIFLYFITLFGSLGIDINQKLGCDRLQLRLMNF